MNDFINFIILNLVPFVGALLVVGAFVHHFNFSLFEAFLTMVGIALAYPLKCSDIHEL